MYGVTPHVYREKHPVSKLIHFKIIILKMLKHYPLTRNFKFIGEYYANHDQTYSNTESRFEELILDVSKPIIAKISRSKNVLIIGELKELLKEDVRSQVLIVKDEIRLDFVGIRHLLSGETIAPSC